MAWDSLTEAKQLLKQKGKVKVSTNKVSAMKTFTVEEHQTEQERYVDGKEDPTKEPTEDEPTIDLFDGKFGRDFRQTEQERYVDEEDEANKEDPSVPDVMNMSMALILPSKFLVVERQGNHFDCDVHEDSPDFRLRSREELLAAAFHEIIPKDKLNRYRHLKPLYIMAHVEGMPIFRIFVDCGATVNVLPLSLMKKLNKTKKNLIPSDVVMSSFVGDKSKTDIGELPLKITVAYQIRIVAFYVVESGVDYNILVSQDWIHQTSCIPSSLFRVLCFWDG